MDDYWCNLTALDGKKNEKQLKKIGQSDKWDHVCIRCVVCVILEVKCSFVYAPLNSGGKVLTLLVALWKVFSF